MKVVATILPFPGNNSKKTIKLWPQQQYKKINENVPTSRWARFLSRRTLIVFSIKIFLSFVTNPLYRGVNSHPCPRQMTAPQLPRLKYRLLWIFQGTRNEFVAHFVHSRSTLCKNALMEYSGAICVCCSSSFETFNVWWRSSYCGRQVCV